jgi:hypothetical protein
MRIDPSDLAALVRRAESAGGKVLRTIVPDDDAPAGPGPARQEIVLPGFRPPSLNRLMRGKIRDRIRLGHEARSRIALEARHANVGRATGRRRVSVEVTLSGRQRPLDVDSIWKALLDGLVSCGLLVDDSCRYCTLGSVVFARGEATSTRVILENVEVSADA